MTELGARLWQAELPDSEQAMRVAARIIAAEVTAPVRAARQQRRQRPWVIALAIGLLIALAFTAPGRAVIGDIGRIVGIGDEPSEPPTANAVVIGTGVSATYPYEVVAFSDSPSADTCIGPQFPNLPGFQVADCITQAARSDLANDGVRAIAYGVPPALYPDAELMIQGEVQSDVTSVEVTYTSVDGESHSGAASISELSEDLAKRIGVSGRAKFFVAFLPPDVLEPPERPGGPLTVDNAQQGLDDITVTARDASGDVVGSSVLGEQAQAARRLSTFLSPAGRFSGPTDFDAPPFRGEAGE